MYDVVIIGSGPGGYVAAIRGAQLGLKVAVIEKEHLGGICLNWGCIPTKALLRCAEVAALCKHAATFGVHVSDVTFDLPRMIEHSRHVVSQLTSGVKALLDSHKVTIIRGTASFKSAKSVVVDGKQVVEGKHFVIATGAKPRHLPGIKPSKRIWTYYEAMTPPFEKAPERMLVIGSGAIGVEFASFYHTLGTQITMVELQDRILPQEDHEVSEFARNVFVQKGWRIFTKQSLQTVNEEENHVSVQFSDGTTDTFDVVLLAIGVVGNTEGLGLENTRVQLDRNQIVIDNFNRTSEPNIYAIGDVVSPPWLAHKASHEGVHVMEYIRGTRKEPAGHRVPGCTYCSPQIASIGLTEAAAREKCKEIKVGRFSFMGNGKALAIGEPQGFVKTIFDAQTGELLGAHMIGPEVTEMIHSMSVAMQLETTEEDLFQTIFPHPTLSEAIHESVLDAFGRSIHWPAKRG